MENDPKIDCLLGSCSSLIHHDSNKLGLRLGLSNKLGLMSFMVLLGIVTILYIYLAEMNLIKQHQKHVECGSAQVP